MQSPVELPLSPGARAEDPGEGMATTLVDLKAEGQSVESERFSQA